MLEEIARCSSKWKTLGNPIDIYYPNPVYLPSKPKRTFPIAFLLPGFQVDRFYYAHYARQMARHGFVVVVPDGITAIRGRAELFARLEQVPVALKELARELEQDTETFGHLLDTQKIILLGHSHGGTLGLDAIRGARTVPVNLGDYSPPKALIAAVFFGTFLWQDNHNLPIDNAQIPIALISGSLDSLISPRETQETYDRIKNSPKAYIMVKGANHYGITNRNHPPGSPPELSQPKIEQAVAIETIARWSALFVRAYALNEPRARQIYHQSIQRDPHVEVLTCPPTCVAAQTG